MQHSRSLGELIAVFVVKIVKWKKELQRYGYGRYD